MECQSSNTAVSITKIEKKNVLPGCQNLVVTAMTTNDLDKLVTHEIFFKAFKKQHLEVSQKASQKKKSSFLNYEKHI